MRALFLIPLVAIATASANPKAKPIDLSQAVISAYLDSEHVLISMSATDAVFSGSFTFATSPGWPGGWFVNFYIWFPEDSAGDPTVDAFWKALGRDDLLATNAVQWEILHRAVGLSIRLGERELSPGNGIEGFSATHYRRPVPLTPVDERVLATFRRHYPEAVDPDKLDELGFCLLAIQFVDNGSVISNRTPFRVSYRQPLARCAGGARFFYMPVFDGLPRDISTADTNRYSITFVARGCSLAVTNGTQSAILDSEASATFAPERHQPFRATATAGPSAQGRANGRQPGSSETNRTPAAAASRRSP
jgi:hypothetical protein